MAKLEQMTEGEIVAKVQHYIDISEATITGSSDDLGESIATIWDDESKLYKGGGLQWKTSLAYRTERSRKIRPNSEDNFIFNSIQNIVSNLTASTPEVTVTGVEDVDDDVAEKITFMSRFNDARNKFTRMWKRQVESFISYGPIIGMVIWDPEWMGGVGPDRWVGEVRLLDVDRRDFRPDPAIVDLEQNLQDCEFIGRKLRIKIDAIKKLNKDIEIDDINEESQNDLKSMQNEGSDPRQTNVYELWHKGKPWMLTNKMKADLLEEATMHEMMQDEYKAQDYKDMAVGEIDGVHCAYICNNKVLKYIPYIYDDGLYPFVYKVRYHDENTQWGFGEIRNIKIPQILHNKADEIELEAMSRQGLGGKYYNVGAVNPKQLEKIKLENGKGGSWLEVDNVNQLADREGVQTPQALITYKEHKQRMIETVSNVTPIQQGMSPGANMPFKAIAALGARTDVRLKAANEILEDYLCEMNKLRISRFAQFYTDDRYYRIKDKTGAAVNGSLNRNQMMLTWNREQNIDPATGQQVEKQEFFVPEFDINVKIMDEKPTDRNYYTQTAMSLYPMGLMLAEDVWYTLEEGKFPPKDEILERLKMKDGLSQMMAGMEQLEPDAQQAFMNLIQTTLGTLTQEQQQQQVMQKGGGQVGR